MESRNFPNESFGNVPTSLVPLVETEHGRLRRRQRGIETKDLKAALKYGSRRSSHYLRGDPTAIYTYKDIVYIVNERTWEEVTSYAVPLKLDPVPITTSMQRSHDRAAIKIGCDLSAWTSNTVIVVDTSGSMRAADVWGTKTRLGAVWISIALDFLAHRLESGTATPMDVISVVTLGEPSQVIIRESPSSWVLYNRLISIYNNATIAPRGHGPFLPALTKAESLLTRNPNAACAMQFTFLSDGVPSDSERGLTREECIKQIVHTVGQLARKFGRRLAFSAIGIGDMEDFDTLSRMVDAANDYGAKGNLELPSMSSCALGNVFSSVATSLTSTKTELTDVNTKKQQKVRDVLRESKSKARQTIRLVSDQDFHIYKHNRVERQVYEEWVVDKYRHHDYKKQPLQHPQASAVALCKEPFGEGAERLAYRFYELASDNKTIVGPPLVAKESRLVLDSGRGDETKRRKFVNTFCRAQQLAGRLAKEFNQKLRETRRVHPATPGVSMLDCSIYILDDKYLGKTSVLVEERLDDRKWQKWNSNNGFVQGMKTAPNFSEDGIRDAMQNLAKVDLGMIEEGSDEDEEDDDDEDGPDRQDTEFCQIIFNPSEVAQAFSHFTYHASGRKRLVCDLQGVFDENENLIKLSDPVIHYANGERSGHRHGRTDRGRKGMAMFFDTHNDGHCGPLCKLMIRGFRKYKGGSGRRYDRRTDESGQGTSGGFR